MSNDALNRWLYPELGKIHPRDRSRALKEAKDTRFDAIEFAGVGIALLLVVVITRYSTAGLGLAERIGAALANFIVSLGLLALFAGPFYMRRIRRGLRRQIDSGSVAKADEPQ